MRIIFVLLAFVIAAATAWWVSGQLQREEIVETRIEKKVVKEGTTGVLVATRTLPTGKMVEAGDFVFRGWPESAAQANKNFIINDGSVKPADFIGAVVREDIVEGMPINNRLVIKSGEQGFIAAVLKPGMRAVAVPVNKRTGVSNLIVPGDLVDLILTSVFRETITVPDPGGEPRREQKEVRVGETIAKNVRVISVGEYLSKPEDRANADEQQQNATQRETIVETITVELPPKLVEAVALANQMGEITVAVAPLASENEELDGIDTSDPASTITGITDEDFRSSTTDTDVSRTLAERGGVESEGGNAGSVVISRGGKTKESETVSVMQKEKPKDTAPNKTSADDKMKGGN